MTTPPTPEQADSQMRHILRNVVTAVTKLEAETARTLAQEFLINHPEHLPAPVTTADLNERIEEVADEIRAEYIPQGNCLGVISDLGKRIHTITDLMAQEIERLKSERDAAKALVASYDRQDELIGTEFEGVDEVTDVLRLLKQERDELKAEIERLKRINDVEEVDKEQARWQNAIYDLCLKYAQVDGGGTESGDPLDFSISEISQALAKVSNERDDLRRQLEESQQKLSELDSLRNQLGHLKCDPTSPEFKAIFEKVKNQPTYWIEGCTLLQEEYKIIQQKLDAAERARAEMRDTLVAIGEYWNGGRESAFDAAQACSDYANEYLEGKSKSIFPYTRRDHPAIVKAEKALIELRATVKGECPSLLNEDSGGNSKLEIEIDEAIAELQALKEGK